MLARASADRSGEDYNNQYCFVFRMRAGKIVEIANIATPLWRGAIKDGTLISASEWVNGHFASVRNGWKARRLDHPSGTGIPYTGPAKLFE